MDSYGPATVLYVYGSGENLVAEESTNWTAGFDFTPEVAPELSISATYFDIDYKRRVSTPWPSEYDVYNNVLLDSTYGVAVIRNPDPGAVNELIRRSGLAYCYTATFDECDIQQYVTQVTALVDERLRNLAGVRMSGIDFSLGYRLEGVIGDWGLNVSGSHLLTNRRQFVPDSPETSEMNNVYRPVDLRLRGSLSFRREGFNAVAAINYIDGYRDTRANHVGQPFWRSTVASWTTTDLTLQYDLGRLWASQSPSETTLTLSGVNVFDRAPPYVASYHGLYYDGVNANPRGRFLSAQVVVRW